MNKEEIYRQIDSFVNQRVGKSKLYEVRFYVDSNTAEDRARFTKWVFKNNDFLNGKEFKNIIDLCYGSGNLTSHILYESNIDTTNLVLNDINTENRNNNIDIGNKTDNDFLDANQFSHKYDLIVFNPQIGGTDTYPQGVVDFEKNIAPIIFDGSFEDYLKNQNISTEKLNIALNEDEKSIFIHSDNLTKTEMKEIFKDIKIFNYYDVLYQSKDTKIEGSNTNIVKFRKTLEAISHHDTIVIFLGEESIYQTLFIDYTFSILYMPDEGKNIYILAQNKQEKVCYEYKDKEFIVNENCKKENENAEDDLDIGTYLKKLNNFSNNESKDTLFEQGSKKEKKNMDNEESKQKFSKKEFGNLNFKYKNILFKGVPGTGKSRAIDNIISKHLILEEKYRQNNTLRINIHSASSNADLMQGIGISTKGQNIIYEEKQGLILDFIRRATYLPNQPFALVLEEIQENSLNELIGDLIYLIDEEKRTDLTQIEEGEYSYAELVQLARKSHEEENKKLLKHEQKIFNTVKMPNLVSGDNKYKEMILPDNLYIFCTSNYRDDKKIIEDNLLRRFEVIEIYPNKDVANEYVKEFLGSLNTSILTVMQQNHEIHPDRYMIGHAIWKDVKKDGKSFYRAFLKLITEFKDIREIEFDIFKNIIKGTKLPDDIEVDIETKESYFDLIQYVQNKIAYDFLG